MSPPDWTRRQFLRSSLVIGAAAAGWAGVATDASATDASATDASATDASATDASATGAANTGAAVLPLQTPPPPPVQTFVSRPEFTPPGVSIARAPNVATPDMPSHIFVAPHTPAGSALPDSMVGLMIMDRSGDLVWWKPTPGPKDVPFNLRVQSYKNTPVLTWYVGDVGSYGFDGTCVIADDRYTEFESVHAVGSGTDAHEFLITAEDTALVTTYETQGDLVVGHAQEVTIGANELVWDWSCYPAVLPSESYSGPTGDYFHINSIDLWPGSARNVLISGRNTCAVYLVDRAAQRIIWRLGGRDSQYAGGPGTRFGYQHDARALPDGSGLSLFDDASGTFPEPQSWAKVIDLGHSPMLATIRHRMNHSTAPVDVGSQGNCQLLTENGGHFVGWGSAPYFSMFGASGDRIDPPLLLDGRLPDGIYNYRAFMFNWRARPRESELVLVVHHGLSRGRFTAYTSWNGATEVAAYKISAGTSSSLESAGTFRRTGFETTIRLDHVGATDFQVAAIDKAGAILGRSRVVGATSRTMSESLV